MTDSCDGVAASARGGMGTLRLDGDNTMGFCHFPLSIKIHLQQGGAFPRGCQHPCGVPSAAGG